MIIEVYGRKDVNSWESSGIVDYQISLTIDTNYRTYDTFTMTLPLEESKDWFNLIQIESILLIKDRFFYVDSIQVDKKSDGKVEISGASLLGKATKRIIEKTYVLTGGYPEKAVWDFINMSMISPTTAARKISTLTLAAYERLTDVRIDNMQTSYENVSDKMTEIMTAYDFGVTEVATDLEGIKQQVKVYKGKDVSDSVEFTADYENIIDEGLINNNVDESNVAYVYGEDQGANRKFYLLDNGGVGVARSEIYVDARDLSQTYTDDGSDVEHTYTDAVYQNMLKTRGINALGDRTAILTLVGDINVNNPLFEYEKDYHVGDRVRITSKTFGVTKTAILTSMKETWDEQGYHLEPAWDQDSATVFTAIKRK
ncbi:MAG: siphovirus ReqiPepy6 Gp37-like family protein [Lactobacillaceae bacterium]|jgi:hypothetical protein|nr:siphovirus ReqiPepy6 Gp37-like family protein [Lactobacillaceae bacterium]